MKILGIVSSPRKGGNSQTLVEHILTGAKEKGATIELVRLCDLDISPCKGCNTCKQGDGCIIDDDMNDLSEKLIAADVVVFGSPVYWFRLNAQAYPFIDRFYAFFNEDFSTGFPTGKKIVVALTSGGSGPEVFNPLNDYLKEVFRYLGFIDAGFICQNNLLAPDDLAQYPEKIREAIDLGRSTVT